MLNRRDMLTLAASGSAASAVLSAVGRSADSEEKPALMRIIDTNVSLFHWPFRRLPLDTTADLIAKLRSLGIFQAWAGSFEGILHRDITSVNTRLVSECSRYPELIPFGTVNPSLPGWENDLKTCFDVHRMPGIRLYPNYHGYTLKDVFFGRLVKLATEAGKIIQIAAALEDSRTQHFMLQVADVDLTPLTGLLTGLPGARVQILNYRPQGTLLNQFRDLPGICFDTARADSTDGVPRLMETISAERVLFGTHAPFLIPEAALIRTHESGQLDDVRLNQLLSDNANRLMTPQTAAPAHG